MLLEVFTIEPGELLPKTTGVRLVELGLSYVLPDSAVPPCYRQAWLQSGDGVHAPNLHGLAECDALAPWQIKNVLMQPDDETTEQWAHGSLQVSCSVRNKVDHLNEANLLIRIPGAGSGQFLRPTPLPPGNQLRIPDGKRICLRRPLPSEVAAESLPTTDYLLEVQVGTVPRLFSPHQYTGEETLRFANQGRLKEGLDELCRESDRASGVQSFSPRAVKEAMKPGCNVKFKNLRHSLFVVAQGDLQSGTDAKELLVDYDISYWVRYVVEHISTLNPASLMVTHVLWALLSVHSVYDCPRDLLSIIPEEVREKYANMQCPVLPRLPRSRR